MNIILDPWFYVFAIPAVLIVGISKSGFGVGFGSLAVPLMALTVTVPQAAALMMPLLFLIDVLGLRVFKKDYDKKLLIFMLPFGLLGTVIGTFLFKYLSVQAVAGCVGFFTLAFLAQRLLFAPKPDSPLPPKWLGAILVTLSGFTSFIAHAGGPPMNAFAIPLKLKPVVFAATLSYFFFAINLSKWIPYAYLGLLDWRNFWTSVLLMPLAALGVWIGQGMARRISPVLFYRLVYAGMLLSGIKLLWDALQ
jgi:uncharacterized membrane protein YfcA